MYKYWNEFSFCKIYNIEIAENIILFKCFIFIVVVYVYLNLSYMCMSNSGQDFKLKIFYLFLLI